MKTYKQLLYKRRWRRNLAGGIAFFALILFLVFSGRPEFTVLSILIIFVSSLLGGLECPNCKGRLIMPPGPRGFDGVNYCAGCGFDLNQQAPTNFPKQEAEQVDRDGDKPPNWFRVLRTSAPPITFVENMNKLLGCLIVLFSAVVLLFRLTFLIDEVRLGIGSSGSLALSAGYFLFLICLGVTLFSYVQPGRKNSLRLVALSVVFTCLSLCCEACALYKSNVNESGMSAFFSWLDNNANTLLSASIPLLCMLIAAFLCKCENWT